MPPLSVYDMKFINLFRVFISLGCALSIASFPLCADTVTDASAYLEDGERALAEKDYPEAERLFKLAREKGSVDANLFLGRLAYLKYDFPQARKYYSAFNASKKKSQRLVPLHSTWLKNVAAAEKSLQRVEKTAVIDTLHVNKNDFFKAYRLSRSSGSLRDSSLAPTAAGQKEANMVFVNEEGDQKLWAQNDTTGLRNIMESIRLTDGTWRHEVALPENLTMGGNTDFPFMLSDGTTLYYASDGTESTGGYDIFIASRDAATGEWMNPQNLGMPYNSPADDYMLAMDEENGFGWWASDRELSPDYVTIYIYMLTDMRRNIDPEHESILSYASLDNPALTLALETEGDEADEDTDAPQTDDAITQEDIDEAKSRIKTLLATEPDYRVPDFSLPMPHGKTYRFYTDFKSPKAKSSMQAYMSALREFNQLSEQLDGQRRSYYSRKSQSLAADIQNGEKRLAALRTSLQSSLSEVYRYELRNR